MTDNMRIWDAVSKTDPKHTKAVSFGARKFTSIDAHWQIMRMTEQFGPIGEGWGYEATHSVATMGDMHLAICDVLIWWQNGNAERIPCRYGPVRGTAELYTIGKRLDDDAPKKCLTDALTKGLSHLGLSADVFLGLFDDNKYVQKMTQEFNKPAEQFPPDADVLAAATRWADTETILLKAMKSREDVTGWNTRNAPALKKLHKNHEALYHALMKTYGEALNASEPMQ